VVKKFLAVFTESHNEKNLKDEEIQKPLENKNKTGDIHIKQPRRL